MTHLDVFVIDFFDSRERFREDLHLDISTRIHHVPAVLAAADARWDPESTSNDLGPGGAGCLLAHLDAMSMIAESGHSAEDRFALVLESDAVLTTFGRRWLPRLGQLRQTEGINFLQIGSSRTAMTRPSLRPFSMDFLAGAVETTALRTWRPLFTQALTSACHAYLIRPSFARKILQLGLGFQVPIDNWFRVLALDPRNKMLRTRQDLFVVSGRPSEIEGLGR